MLGVYETPADAAKGCAARVLEILKEAVDQGRDATFAVSGGSTPKLMFAALAAAQFDWRRVHLFWVDERCVPPDDEQSNYKLAKECLIDPAGIPLSNVHRMPGELDPAAAAALYSEDLAAYFGPGMPAFDVIHCGMGPDGHTASLFPGDPLIADRAGLAASVYAPKLPNWRVTLLPGVLLGARHTLMLVTGADKADMLWTVLHGEKDPMSQPVHLLAHRPEVEWFLDMPAAVRVNPGP
jgi:6-phosphogluconolactonase